MNLLPVVRSQQSTEIVRRIFFLLRVVKSLEGENLRGMKHCYLLNIYVFRKNVFTTAAYGCGRLQW